MFRVKRKKTKEKYNKTGATYLQVCSVELRLYNTHESDDFVGVRSKFTQAQGTQDVTRIISRDVPAPSPRCKATYLNEHIVCTLAHVGHVSRKDEV